MIKFNKHQLNISETRFDINQNQSNSIKINQVSHNQPTFNQNQSNPIKLNQIQIKNRTQII